MIVSWELFSNYVNIKLAVKRDGLDGREMQKFDKAF